MDGFSPRLAALATRIQTPLGLAGLALIVLYALVSQVLKLDIFDKVGGSGTLQIMNNLLDKLFYLAVSSLVLAGLTYIANLYFHTRPPARRSKLELIDARLDENSSEYVNGDQVGHRRVIRRRSPTTPGKK
jgi:hypothetical protein